MFIRPLFFFLFVLSSAVAQNGYEGTEFFFAFPPNDGAQGVGKLFLDISSRFNARGTVFYARGTRSEWREAFNFRAGSSQRVTLPNDFELTSADGGMPTSRTLFIESDNPVTVRALNREYHSSEATSVLPTSRWGKEYFVVSYTDDWLPGSVRPQVGGEAVIIATFDDTRITITPHSELHANADHDIPTRVANKPFSITLDRGQEFFLESSARQGLLQDITGTHIVATKPVGLISGHRLAALPTGVNQFCLSCEGRNHLLEMIAPVESWGKRVLTQPFATRTRGDGIRILAAHDGTRVARNGEEISILSAGAWVDIAAVQEPALWSANEPILVVQYSYSRDVDAAAADPFYVAVPPIDGAMFGDVLLKIQDFGKNFVGVVAENAIEGVITLDNVALEECEHANVRREGKFLFATLELKKGIHTLSSVFPFVALTYGFDTLDGYGYAAHAGLRQPGIEPDSTPPEFHLERSGCGEYAVVTIGEHREHDNGIARVDIVPDRGAEGKNLVIDRDRSSTERNIMFIAHTKDSTRGARGMVVARDIVGNMDSVLIELSPIPVLDIVQLPTPAYDSGTVAMLKVYVANRTHDTLTVPSFALRAHRAFTLISSDEVTLVPGGHDTVLLSCAIGGEDVYYDTLSVQGACIALRNSVLRVDRAYPKLSVRLPTVRRLQLLYGDTAEQGAPVVLQNTGTSATIVTALYSNDSRLDVETYPRPPFVLEPGEIASAFVHVSSSRLIGKASLVIESNASPSTLTLPIESVPAPSRIKLATLATNAQKRFSIDKPIADTVSQLAVIRYTIPHDGKVRHALRSPKGKNIFSEELSSREGPHQWVIDTSHLDEGTYSYSVKYSGSEGSGRIVVRH